MPYFINIIIKFLKYAFLTIKNTYNNSIKDKNFNFCMVKRNKNEKNGLTTYDPFKLFYICAFGKFCENFVLFLPLFQDFFYEM